MGCGSISQTFLESFDLSFLDRMFNLINCQVFEVTY